jgi:hypothetical protein
MTPGTAVRGAVGLYCNTHILNMERSALVNQNNKCNTTHCHIACVSSGLIKTLPINLSGLIKTLPISLSGLIKTLPISLSGLIKTLPISLIAASPLSWCLILKLLTVQVGLNSLSSGNVFVQGKNNNCVYSKPKYVVVLMTIRTQVLLLRSYS